MNTFAFRPHAGETGDVMHLAATYMLATSINHGINLEHQVVSMILKFYAFSHIVHVYSELTSF